MAVPREDFEIVVDPKTIFPTGSRAISSFLATDSAAKHDTAHEVSRLIEFDSEAKEIFNLFFKHNPAGTLISELESVAAAFCAVVAPSIIPRTHAVYNQALEYIGVASEEIPGFKDMAADPLKLEDLDTSFIDEKNLSIEELDDLNAEFCQLVSDNQRQLRREHFAHFMRAPREEFKQSEESKREADKKIADFYAKIAKRNITLKEFENFRIKKGLAICLAVSLIFKEDDLHRRNFSKFGMRLDFDMAMFGFTYPHKDSKLVVLRKPSDDTFKVTPEDLSNFPNVKHCGSYWPAKESVLPDQLSVSVNRFTPQDIELFRRLAPQAKPVEAEEKRAEGTAKKSLDVFQYFAFATWLRFILTDKQHYLVRAKEHMREECTFGSQAFVEVLAEQQKARIEEYQAALAQVPQFIEFYKKSGERIKQQLCKDLNAQGLSSAAIDAKFKRLAKIFRPAAAKRYSIFKYATAESKKADITTACQTIIVKIKSTMAACAQRSSWGYLGTYLGYPDHSDFANHQIMEMNTWRPSSLSDTENFHQIEKTFEALADKLESLAATKHDPLHAALTRLLEEITQVLVPANLGCKKNSPRKSSAA